MDKLTLAADGEEQGGCHWLKGSDFPRLKELIELGLTPGQAEAFGDWDNTLIMQLRNSQPPSWDPKSKSFGNVQESPGSTCHSHTLQDPSPSHALHPAVWPSLQVLDGED